MRVRAVKPFRVNEIFYSLQGEGVRAGTANLFVRFQGCNLRCRRESHGFDCDTEFVSGTKWTAEEIVDHLKELAPDCPWVVLTGGEPARQLDTELVKYFHERGYRLAVETNGTIPLPKDIDWITVSPKVAEHSIRQRVAHEVKYVRAYGQGIPYTVVRADHYLISPAFEGDALDPRTLQWCIDLVKGNPRWRLSVQLHKLWSIR
jgi:7-carboxy-7-deazaguanine synthase